MEKILCRTIPPHSQAKNPNETRRRKRALPPFNCHLLVLCRCRQDFSIQHLAWLFKGKHSTISSSIITWVNYVYLRLSIIPMWPTREVVEQVRPESMKMKFPRQGGHKPGKPGKFREFEKLSKSQGKLRES